METCDCQPRRREPLKALKALRALLRDQEDTRQVFAVLRALGGNNQLRGLRRLRKTAGGQRILGEKRDLIRTLQDRERLAVLPVGSLGRTYFDFVYGEGLTAEGLVAESVADADELVASEDFKRYACRNRDSHDLWHTVTGYGRDAFGELCLLAFTYAQAGNIGLVVIALVGTAKLKRLSPRARIFRALWQAYRNGRRSAWLPAVLWEDMLDQPLEDVRAALNIAPPSRYIAEPDVIAMSRSDNQPQPA